MKWIKKIILRNTTTILVTLSFIVGLSFFIYPIVKGFDLTAMVFCFSSGFCFKLAGVYLILEAKGN